MVALNYKEKRNVYSEREVVSTSRLLSHEFRSLGCHVKKIGRTLFVRREGKVRFLLETETSFTSLLAYRILKNKDLARTVFQEVGLNVRLIPLSQVSLA